MESVSSEGAKMKIKGEVSEKRIFSGFEKILLGANKNYVTSCNKRQLQQTRIQVEQIISKLVATMKKQSLPFSKLYVKTFGVGSAYDRTKIGEPNEFDIDIVLKIPEAVKPVVKEDEVTGFVQVQLKSFQNLHQVDADMFKTLKGFVDEDNYMLSQEMMLLFIYEILTEAKKNYFPNGIIKVDENEYVISKIQYIEPALTLTIDGPDFVISVDLVASFLLSGDIWVKTSRRIPSSAAKEIFLAPARPVEDQIHKERFWRLSFHLQEREIMLNRQWMKPALRVLKKIRDHFKQKVHSYALKTLFLWELSYENPNLDTSTPPFWKSSLSCVIVHMLEKYLKSLQDRIIPYFWNSHSNLLSYLSGEELDQYQRDITEILDDIKKNPESEILEKYFK